MFTLIYTLYDYNSILLLFFSFSFPQKDVGNETNDICDTSVAEKKIIVTYGQSVSLGCFTKVPEVLRDQEITWYHHFKKIHYSSTKHYASAEGGLTMLSMTEQDAGRYDCHLGGSLLCSYSITVDAHRCTPPNRSSDYQKIYSEWCHEFQKYKSAMKVWEKKQVVSFWGIKYELFVVLTFSFNYRRVDRIKFTSGSMKLLNFLYKTRILLNFNQFGAPLLLLSLLIA